MKIRLSRILIAALLFGLTVITPVFAKGGNEATGSGKKIVVADANSTHHLDLYVAYEKGLFSKRGLDMEIQQTSSGVAAVVGGEADIVFNCPTGVITPIAKGQNIIIISQVKIPCTSVLVVPVNSPVKKPQDVNKLQIAGLSTTCCAVIATRSPMIEMIC